jgi:hypothetical protein
MGRCSLHNAPQASGCRGVGSMYLPRGAVTLQLWYEGAAWYCVDGLELRERVQKAGVERLVIGACDPTVGALASMALDSCDQVPQRRRTGQIQ